MPFRVNFAVFLLTGGLSTGRTLCSAQELLQFWNGAVPQDYLGFNLLEAGDVDGDQVPDLLASGTGANTQGFVVLYSGRDASVLQLWPGVDPAGLLGSSMALLDDVDGDGIRDVALGNAFAAGGGTQNGEVLVYSAGTGALLYPLAGASVGDTFGWALAALDDLNGDGARELVVGAPRWSPQAADPTGYVRVVSGSDGATLFEVSASAALDFFGGTLAGLGDVDGDAVPDFAVGALLGNYVQVLRGSDGTLIYELHPPGPPGQFGVALTRVPDLDGDQVSELLVGDNVAGGAAGPYLGGAHLFSGATQALLHTFEGFNSYSNFGATCAGLADASGDGRPDLLIGAYGDLSDGGDAYLFSGGSFALLYHFRGIGIVALGRGVGAAGDFNGDTLADLALGSPGFSFGGSYLGRVEVRAGNDLFLEIEPDLVDPGQLVTLTTREGLPGDLALLALVDVDGTPTFVIVGGLAKFDSTGSYILAGNAPPGLSGVDLTFLALAQGRNGGVVDSARELVKFK